MRLRSCTLCLFLEFVNSMASRTASLNMGKVDGIFCSVVGIKYRAQASVERLKENDDR